TLRSLAASYLRQGGFQVLLAGDGKEAVAVYQREHPRIDLVILDQMMPHLTGQDALEEIRRINPDARVLLASASGGGGSNRTAPDKPGSSFVSKPYRERDLLQAVLAALK